MKRRVVVTYGTILLSAALFCGCAGESGTNSPKIAENRSMQEAESSPIVFTCQDVNGNSVSETIFSQSKLTMVNVWATYCSPCLNEMPGLGELAVLYDPKEFQIIGVISDVQEGADEETIAAAAELIEATGADYTHLLLSESVYFTLLKDVTAVPTTFFIDESGTVLDTVVGAMEKSEWEEKINALLEEQ